MPWTKESYRRYLRTLHWRSVKNRYHAKYEYRCCVARCPVRNRLELHHLTYERVGRERLTDLVYLCQKHHDLVTRKAIAITSVQFGKSKKRP